MARYKSLNQQRCGFVRMVLFREIIKSDQ